MPIQRYHPAVVAQKAATLQILVDGRFTLGPGSGENLAGHATGEGWPPVDQRQDLVVEAIEIIREPHGGELVTYDGQYLRVDSARIWDVPDVAVPIAIAAGGPKGVRRFGPLADHLIDTEPTAEVVQEWNALDDQRQIGHGARAIGQIPICWHPDSKDAAMHLAHEQVRWCAGGWADNADLPRTTGFAGASKFAARGCRRHDRVRIGPR